MSIGSTLLSGKTVTTTTITTTETAGSGTPVRLVSRSTEWMADGECRNHAPETFFPSDGVGVDRARKICATCKVQNHCLEYALAEEIEHGVWGGASERERRRIKKRRRAEAGL
jgi:WhiB family redox-sensing transcriptional regulator